MRVRHTTFIPRAIVAARPRGCRSAISDNPARSAAYLIILQSRTMLLRFVLSRSGVWPIERNTTANIYQRSTAVSDP